MYALYLLVDIGLRALMWLIIIWAILGWLIAFNVVRGYHPVVQSIVIAIGDLLEPLLRPIRRLLPPTSGIDFSPLVLMILIYVVRMSLNYYVFGPWLASGGA